MIPVNVENIIQGLSLEEKAALLQGWTTWTTLDLSRKGIPPIFLSDGPHGLRKQAGAGDHLGLNASVPATCFPTAATMANTWNPELGEELGAALGEEAAANDVHVLLGPGLNIKRSPLCGRNFEYFSEDPYLAGKMAAAYVRGIQSKGVAACPKHFAVNSQELRRMAMNAVVDERTLREIYLTGFEIAVREGYPRSIMTAYNMVNGVYANENAHLLREILREDWGFDGFVVTDWGADNDHEEGVRAGSDLVMPAPGADCALQLVEAVRAGRLEEAVLDARLRELLPVMAETRAAVSAAPKNFDQEAHHTLARRCAEEAVVLLENDGILPLSREVKTAIIGEFAENPRFQGAGSSLVNPTRLDNLKDCLDKAGLDIVGYAKGYSRTNPQPDYALIDGAVSLARVSEVVLLCVGLDEIMESEGLDRKSLALSRGQQKLIEAVCKVNDNVILVLSGGAPFLMPPRGSFRAAIHGYLGGQAGAAAMADALLGNVCPGGKLNETWPESLESVPSTPWFPSRERTAEYREGLFVGYRYYQTRNVPVRYPFGHGLSYTSFTYGDLRVDKEGVDFTLENTGVMAGAEIAQVYISCKNGRVFRPKLELKGFQKVFLQPGEKRQVHIPLDDKAFRFFNVKTNTWATEGGDYEILVGASAADLRLRGEVRLSVEPTPLPYRSLPHYESGDVQRVSDEEFEALLGSPIPDGSWGGLLEENDALEQMRYAKSSVARLVCRILNRQKARAEASGKPDLNILFIINMPFRAMAKMAGGLVSRKMVEDILFLVNGHFWRGLGRLIRDYFRNRKKERDFVKLLEEESKPVKQSSETEGFG